MEAASALDPAAAVQPGGSRGAALDGLRGVAALVVVAFHVSALVTWHPAALWIAGMTPLGVVVNGPAAVHVFFVLSGFVLTHSLMRTPGAAGTLRYCVRRVFRIHPPYMAAVLFAWALTFLPPGAPALTAVALEIPALRRLLASLAAVFLGRISYSLYLVHWSVAMLLGRLVGAPGSALAALLFFAVVTLVSCAVAMLGWRWIEQPSIRAGRALVAVFAPRPAGTTP